MIQLLGRATSGNVQKVLFLLEELGLPYERKDYGRQWENTTTPEYVAMNPIKKVPTLVDGSTVVWQSNTVLRYLASKANSALYPADAEFRHAYAVYGAQRATKILGIFTRLATRDGKPAYLALRPRVASGTLSQ